MFGALRHREFRLLWVGQVLSNIGWWMQNFGLGWLVVQIAFREGTPERAPLYLGFVGLSRAVPALAIGLIAGALVDRADRRQVLFVTQAAAGGLAAILAVLTATGVVTLGWVLLVSLLGGTVAVFDAPARQAVLGRQVPQRDIMSAIGLQNVATHGTGVIGPAFGGLLIGPVGVAGLFAANALGYLPSLIALALMRPMTVTVPGTGRSILGSVRESLRYVAGDPMLRWAFLLAAATSFLARPYLNLLPAFVANTLRRGPEELSLLLTVTGVGSLFAAVTIAGAGRLKRRGLLYILACGACGIFVVALAPQSSLEGSLVVAFGLGYVTLFYMGLLSTIIQTTVPEHLLGRVVSLQVLNWMVLLPFGQLVVGAVGSSLGIDMALAVAGVIGTLAAGYVLWRAPHLRGLAPPARHPASIRSATAGD